MPHTLVIAEPGMTWDRDLDKAYRLIDAAKACGSDVCKFQWTSNGKKIQQRRQVDAKYAAIYERGVQYPREWLEQLKGHCDSVGIEFACTSYLIEDIPIIAPLVKRFKVSAYEADWTEFVHAHFYQSKETIISSKCASTYQVFMKLPGTARPARVLHCVSKYPTKLEDLHLRECSYEGVDGLSDHSANVLTGAAAVAAGASVVEVHIKLKDTLEINPDYPHSLFCEDTPLIEIKNQAEEITYGTMNQFKQYVANIRTVERML